VAAILWPRHLGGQKIFATEPFEVHVWEGGLQVLTEDLRNAFTIFLRYIAVNTALQASKESE
jgi:hypothetical protein